MFNQVFPVTIDGEVFYLTPKKSNSGWRMPEFLDPMKGLTYTYPLSPDRSDALESDRETLATVAEEATYWLEANGQVFEADLMLDAVLNFA
jgi:hypothetical protein